MPGIKRRPTPAGPISDLFEAVHLLYVNAGEPSLREMVSRIGTGSPTTVHNVLRGPKVPIWGWLQLVVEALRGDPDDFMELWKAAIAAERGVDQPGSGQQDRGQATGGRQRYRSGEIPPRNPDFTGRDQEFDLLRRNLTGRPTGSDPKPQVLCGMGGVGKTEIATEYLHRYWEDYDIIWWIRAEHPDRVRDALVRLGQQLGLPRAGAGGDRDLAIDSALETLSNGPDRWLLVFDNADEPLDLQRYLPQGRPSGDVLITSRRQTWPAYIAESIEVSPFETDEAVAFLRRKVPALRVADAADPEESARRKADAARVAEALGNLPIAMEHAAAYLSWTSAPVEDYLGLLGEGPRERPARARDVASGQQAVSTTWTASVSVLSPDAISLFNLCAFFSPEPISMDLLVKGAQAVTVPVGLKEVLADEARFRKARSQLQRLSLAKVDGARNLVQVHRVVQKAARAGLDGTATAEEFRAAVHALLAASDPGNPDRSDNDPAYERSFQHIEAGNVLDTDDQGLRALIINQVRRLHLRGGHVEALRVGEEALELWRDRLGPDDIQVLSLAVEVAIAMRLDGRAADARSLTLDTLRRLERNHGRNHEVALLCTNTYGGDLRALGQFQEALSIDLDLLPRFEMAFHPKHERVFNVLNNIAADYRRLGQYGLALEYDKQTYLHRLATLGEDDVRTLHSRDSVARDLRGQGWYEESLEVAREVHDAFAAIGGRENLDALNARKGFAVALRKAGYHWDALQLSEEVVQRYRDFLTSSHAYTLRAGANLICDRRIGGDLAAAEALGRELLELCRDSSLPPSDITYAIMVNLASVLRAGGNPAEARALDAQAGVGLKDLFGDLHPLTLAAAADHASDLAAAGDLAEALTIGRQVVDKFRRLLGWDHPDTLAAATNLAIDLATAEEGDEAEELFADCAQRYEQTLGPEHPEARWAVDRVRLSLDIEPY